MAAVPRPKPCDSCPYRRDVPSGLWQPHEYAKLPAYDLPTGDQPIGVFFCHQADGRVCAGWANLANRHTLALRFPFAGVDQDACIAYTSPVPCFATHAEAAAHGLAEVDEPGPAAIRKIIKLSQLRDRRNRREGAEPETDCDLRDRPQP